MKKRRKRKKKEGRRKGTKDEEEKEEMRKMKKRRSSRARTGEEKEYIEGEELTLFDFEEYTSHNNDNDNVDDK